MKALPEAVPRKRLDCFYFNSCAIVGIHNEENRAFFSLECYSDSSDYDDGKDGNRVGCDFHPHGAGCG